MLILLWLLIQDPPKPEWFFFARRTDGDTVTKAYGPYESRKACNVEGHLMMPTDPRFMTNAQRKAFEKQPEQPANKPAYVARSACKLVK